MKSPYFTEEHDIFRDQVRKFVEAEVTPHVEAGKRNKRFPGRSSGGWGTRVSGINYPEAYGGSEADIFYTVVLMEELARCNSAAWGSPWASRPTWPRRIFCTPAPRI